MAFGVAIGTYEIANTSMGWHLASGRIILDEGRFLREDPFSFTAEGTEWVDHEWLFQVIVAQVERCSGDRGLVALRALLVAGLTLLVLFFGLSSGLSPPAALLLACLCIYGAHIRFYLRPELFTLFIVPTAVWIYLRREDPGWRGAAPFLLVMLMVLGINLHGAALVLPVLLGGVLAVEMLAALRRRELFRSSIPRGIGLVAATAVAGVVNPYGWEVFTVPLRLARIVGLPQVPNPEWISPSPSDLPSLYVGLACGLVVLATRERDLRRWILFAMGAALALRYVRNVGLFFVLLPLAVAPALARFSGFARSAAVYHEGRDRRHLLLAGLLVMAVAAAIISEPRHILHPGLSISRYPLRACEFMEREGLISKPMYNDVRFGGYLINRYYPERQVFIDDRNEIHEAMLTEIYSIFQASDVTAWSDMLGRYDIETALLRYNAPFRIETPDGEELGYRGFSALWFPSSSWALVYWDDAAMVFVQRTSASPELLERREYHLIRPDDLDHLRARIADEPGIRRAVASELHRKLQEEPDNRIALEISAELLGVALTGGRP